MRIMVFDVPAESGGALTILNQYYERALEDTENNWFFIVSTPQLDSDKNVKVLKYPWIKKSWMHRLFFDNFIAPTLVKKYKINEILSLQNTTIPNVNIKQTLYLHQPLPFIEKKYGLKENLKFWFYQNIIGKMIFKSIKSADKVIVQTKWIMEAAVEKTGVDKEKFVIRQPQLNQIAKKMYPLSKEKHLLFFFPASGAPYKNHEIIVKACRELRRKGIENFKVVFTLEGDENKIIKKLYNTSIESNLPIEFIGSIDAEKVYEYYSKTTLLFPSYVETYGLPLAEGKSVGALILASDTLFSQEILEGYEDAYFFNPFDVNTLVTLMLKCINQEI